MARLPTSYPGIEREVGEGRTPFYCLTRASGDASGAPPPRLFRVQRLGRILRKRPGKTAVLYEICSLVSAEAGVSERRRQHRAYMDKD